MKYKALTLEQLSSLEKEFVDFLVLNGIVGSDWVRMKESDKEAAEQMTELFSDVVWEGILRKTQYLDFRSPHSVKCFQCLADQIVLVGMDSEELDLLSDADFAQIQSGAAAQKVKVYTTSKTYSKDRELELWDMLCWGCEISDGDLFKQLCLLV